ncbi:MAG: hypothetical protein A2889_01620 [Nitrospinae bacterium RIFCSPLOWO2_01_FULL_39_10]|nr:MAG: hypothetical protein A2889_01620 [Nitrospinae bacterium RIFCSPLOWO2_01_FULL_39_10]
MKMKKLFSIILLSCIVVMNTGILCESLCLTGHSNIIDSHKPHNMMSHAKNESSETQACPISETHNHSDNAESKTFIKCDCSSDHEVSISDVILLSDAPFNLTPQIYLISHLSPYKSSFINVEHSPLEKPPKILI